jgi:hypothetical protein
MVNLRNGTRVLLGGFEYGPGRNLFECWSLAGTRVRIQGLGLRLRVKCKRSADEKQHIFRCIIYIYI